MNLTTFTYNNNKTIRVITDSNGSPWFVLTDICAALELSNKDTTILKGYEKSVVSIKAFGVKHKITTINHPNDDSVVVFHCSITSNSGCLTFIHL